MAKGKPPVVQVAKGPERPNGKAFKKRPKVFDPVKGRLVTKVK